MPLKNYQIFETKNASDTLLDRFEKNSKWINPYLKKYYDLKLQFPETFVTSLASKEFSNPQSEKKNQDTILEIGSYYGEILKFLLRDFPQYSIIGMDITYKRIVKSYLTLAQTDNIKSLHMLMANAKALSRYFPENYLNGILIFFPDPWPKAKHEKHRLLNEDFILQATKVLKPGGFLWIKTDQKTYFDTCSQILQSNIHVEPSDISLHVPTHQDYCSAFQERFKSQGQPYYEGCWKKKLSIS